MVAFWDAATELSRWVVGMELCSKIFEIKMVTFSRTPVVHNGLQEQLTAYKSLWEQSTGHDGL